jgi:hypothetical protein
MYGTKSTRENAESLDQAVASVFRTLAKLEAASPAAPSTTDSIRFQKKNV